MDGGKFPWGEHKVRCRRLSEPDVSYHGVVYAEALGVAAYIGRAPEPMAAFQIPQGIETLALRMDRIGENAVKVAWVNYAGLPEHRDHALVQRYMGGKASGIISFGVKSADAIAAGSRFQNALQLVTRLSIGIGHIDDLLAGLAQALAAV